MITISKDSFQDAWAEAIRELLNHNNEIWSLVVEIKQPLLFDKDKHISMEAFAARHPDKIIPPNQVSYTIFPEKIYRHGRPKDTFYNRINLVCIHTIYDTRINKP
ncbi:MAG: hypothetical protein LBL71_03850 [Endomicrobium sp.]|nr:hypothetical protein [Endomicrobium sp.]